jgi:hypothetical protein
MSNDEAADRLRELETRIEELEETVKTNRRHAEHRISSVIQRIAKLEDLALNSNLGVESELSEMERILCGLDDEPPVGTSEHRAVILAQLWPELPKAETDMGDVVNLQKHPLKMLVTREERNIPEAGLDGTLGNKQIVRAMDAFAAMFDGKAERRKNTHTGVNELVISNPDEVIWSREELHDRLREDD